MASDQRNFCAMLRTKTGYCRAADGTRLINPDSTTACYVCLRTFKAVGPDGLPVEARECSSERVCFAQEG